MGLRILWDTSNASSSQVATNDVQLLEDIDLTGFSPTPECAIPLKALYGGNNIGFRYLNYTNEQQAVFHRWQVRLASDTEVMRLASLLEPICPCKATGPAVSSTSSPNSSAVSQSQSQSQLSSSVVTRAAAKKQAASHRYTPPSSPNRSRAKAKVPTKTRAAKVVREKARVEPNSLLENRDLPVAVSPLPWMPQPATLQEWSFDPATMGAAAPPPHGTQSYGPPSHFPVPHYFEPIAASPSNPAAAAAAEDSPPRKRRIYDLDKQELFDYAVQLCQTERDDFVNLCKRLEEGWKEKRAVMDATAL